MTIFKDKDKCEELARMLRLMIDFLDDSKSVLTEYRRGILIDAADYAEQIARDKIINYTLPVDILMRDVLDDFSFDFSSASALEVKQSIIDAARKIDNVDNIFNLLTLRNVAIREGMEQL